MIGTIDVLQKFNQLFTHFLYYFPHTSGIEADLPLLPPPIFYHLADVGTSLKGGTYMSKQDKKIIEIIANAVRVLPNDKLEYLLGVADGMTAMAAAAETSRSAERRDGA